MEPKLYRKKPVVIEAMQLLDTMESRNEVLAWLGANAASAFRSGSSISIQTLEGQMRAEPGDYIIRGVQGEFYPCKPDIFHQTYEEATS